MRYSFTLLLIFLFAVAGAPAPAGPLVSAAHAADQAAGVYRCPMHPEVVSDKPGQCPICHMSLVPVKPASAPSKPLSEIKKGALPAEPARGYRCPMHPEVVSDKPGQCPICHMDLVAFTAVAEHGPHPAGHAAVTIEADKQKLIGLRVGAVSKKSLTKTFRVPGVVAHDKELYDAQAAYIKSLRSTRLYLRDEYPRPRLIGPTEADVAKLRLMELGMDADSIAEFSENSGPDRSLLHLDPSDGEWVYARVFENDAPLIHKGDKARVSLGTATAGIFHGEVMTVSPFADPVTRTVKVRIKVPNAGSVHLRPEMNVNVSIETSLGEALAVPEEALLWTGTRGLVFVQTDDERFEPRELEIGRAADHDYEVLSGLREGEKVVVNGNFLIDSESRLKSALSEYEAGHRHD